MTGDLVTLGVAFVVGVNLWFLFEYLLRCASDERQAGIDRARAFASAAPTPCRTASVG